MKLLLVLCALAVMPQESDEECKKAMDAFRVATRSAGEAAWVSAIDELGKHKCEKSIALLAPLLGGGYENSRKAAAKALGSFDDPKAVEALAEGVNANLKSHEVLEALAKAFEDIDWEIGVTRLNLLLGKHDDKDILEALHVIVPMLGKLGSSTSVEPLAKLLQHVENEKGGLRRQKGNTRLAALESPIRKALEEITGGVETTSKKWTEWWNQNRERLTAGATLIYRCKATGKRWSQKAGEALKCPYHDKAEKDGQLVTTRIVERKKP
jgi:HEAT repeat protein